MDILEQLLREEEGERLTVYNDSRGIPTIGVGRNLLSRGITADESAMLLQNDIARVCEEVQAALPWIKQLSNVRQAVLQDMAFQMGTEGLLEFKEALAYIRTSSWADAQAAMLDSEWARQTPARAQKLAAIMLSGVYTKVPSTP